MDAKWVNGPPQGPGWFPIAVWLQDPELAARYKAAGINVYIGLWRGPTQEQLAALSAVGMKVICDQNAVGLRHLHDKSIIGWMHGDEPDNAQDMARTWKDDAEAANSARPGMPPQTLEQWGKYGPPIPAQRTIRDYEAIRAKDPSRPVLLNLGQGVANDDYVGRGVRRGHLEDFPEYMKGCDIVSYDIYPVTSPYPHVKDNLWYVPRGVERLLKWAEGRKVVWNVIECTHISSDSKPTPAQVRAEAWMSLIAGSKGLVYFVHEWRPKVNDHALLDDAEMLEAVTALNCQIHELAPVLNSPALGHGVDVKSAARDVPVAATARRHDGATYVFAAGMRAQATTVRFRLEGLPSVAEAEVLGEQRILAVKNGRFEDDFAPYGVHLYRIR
jgi:hypothetical protein